ncbi:MAG: CcdB family protein, partial [Burkholderiales bacterium]|nr:CcdB family protein [Burkholderiales bacterium]
MMAQYDVYVNPNPRSRDSVPFVVDIQSGFIDVLRTRLTMPLSRVGVDIPDLPKRLLPQFVVEG